MDSTPTSGACRKILFWALLVVGTTVLLFGLLLTQTPGRDRAFDVIVLSIAGVLLATALVLGRFRLVPALFLGAELLACLYALISAVTYRGR
jgi:hypothetical protein